MTISNAQHNARSNSLEQTTHLAAPADGSLEISLDQGDTMDAMETYFECITTCSLEDGECITQCVEELRQS